MFKSIDIAKFGLFTRFNWQNNLKEFERVNIIYGRNYSGKTTLSRIFDCVAQGKMHKDYADGTFTLHTDSKRTPEVTNSNLHYDGLVRVYNADFVSRNLSWLKNEDKGEIRPFTLIGSDNVVAQQEIDRIDAQLGSVEGKTGLTFDFDEKDKQREGKQMSLHETSQRLDNQLRDKANREIKANPHFLKQGTTYTISSIKGDIEKLIERTVNKKTGEVTVALKKYTPLSEDEKAKLKRTIDEAEKTLIEPMPEKEPHLRELLEAAQTLVKKRITMTKVLAELVDNDLLQAWVDQGRKINKDRGMCAFCGNPISPERWEALNAHYSKESDELKQELINLKSKLELSDKALDSYLETKGFIEKNIYAEYLSAYTETQMVWNAYVKDYKEAISKINALIDERLANIFRPVEGEPLTMDDLMGENAGNFKEIVKVINDLIEKNNDYTGKLDNKKQEARTKLRMNEVYKYCMDINYVEVTNQMEKVRLAVRKLEDEISILNKQIGQLMENRKQWELKKKDEGEAAKKVTELLVNHFGNDSLSLVPEHVEEHFDVENQDMIPARTRFVVKRGDDPAKNLSEGERSLISFCYFIAKMEDELNGPEAGKLVIFIDDPISSLDSSHIFFMYSLIDKKIAEGKKYGQLFVSTHNLDFLKYLKRLTIPLSERKEPLLSHYLIDKTRRGEEEYKCNIKAMPDYLKNYVTEYNFLFEQIYEMASPLVSGDKTKRIENSYTHYYNIGNNMRKFLECYLFYRYPNTDDPMKNLGTLFEDYVPTEVNRIVNEYSHLAFGERGIRVVDVPEIERAARKIMMAVKTKDPTHYVALCNSVHKDENVDFN